MDTQVLGSGLGGEIDTKSDGRLQACVMCWVGLPNVACWIDRDAGLRGPDFLWVIKRSMS